MSKCICQFGPFSTPTALGQSLEMALVKEYNVGWFLVVNFYFFSINFCWFVAAIFDLVRDVEAIFHLPYVLTASGNLF